MDSTRQRKILVIVLGLCLLLLFIGLAALNAFRMSFLSPTTPVEIVLYTSVSIFAFVLFVGVLLVMMRNVLKLYAEQRSGVLGGRLRTRMMWGAVLLSLVPIGCMFGFSYLLMNRAVERWFSQPASQLRDESSRVSLDLSRYISSNARSEAEGVASSLLVPRGGTVEGEARQRVFSTHDATLQGGFLLLFHDGQLQWQYHLPPGTAQLSVWSPRDGGSEDDIPPQQVSPFHTVATGSIAEMAWQASHRGDDTVVRAGQTDYIVGLARIKAGDAVLAALPLPDGMTAHIVQLNRAEQQYWTLFRLRRQIRTTYMLLMLMITSLSLFVSSWIALYLSKQVTRPVETIAEAMSAIAGGNYQQRVQSSATEELGGLAQSFNTMAEDLETSRRLVDQTTVQVFEANVELEARRLELETMLQTIPNGVVLLDTDRRIRVANRAFSEMLDPGGQRMFPGEMLNAVMPADTIEHVDRLLQRSHRMGTAGAEMDMRAPAGTLNVAVTVAVLESNNAGVRTATGYVLVLEDATELLRAQKQSAWKEVARRVAHEIKNPLTPISLSAEQIRRHVIRIGATDRSDSATSPSLATIQRCSEVISTSVESMRSLVDQFSSLAQFPNAQPRPADLNTIVENTLALFAGRLQSIDVVRALKPGLPLVMADPEAIKRALSNLIDNAAEAMSASLVRRITIHTGQSAAAPGMLELVIADTGPGVTDEMRERLFLPYFSTKQRGTGLGLTIAAKIVADHHGNIRAEKNTPAGARFVLEFPVATSSETPLMSAEESSLSL